VSAGATVTVSFVSSVFSPLLLQATKAVAITAIAKNFFILL
jgi:hypothetical protein